MPGFIEKPYSTACERNRDPILSVLRRHFADRRRVLEIGSGTGQHAVYFAAVLPHLVWQTSDRRDHHDGIRAWLAEAALPNVLGPLALDVNDAWPDFSAGVDAGIGTKAGVDDHSDVGMAARSTVRVEARVDTRFDAVFSANTLHIMSWHEVERLFAGLPGVMTPDARLVIYGPFNYGGEFTSASNAAFDRSLRQSAAHMGIRDFEAVDALARGIGLTLVEDVAMPANNRCLVWATP